MEMRITISDEKYLKLSNIVDNTVFGNVLKAIDEFIEKYYIPPDVEKIVGSSRKCLFCAQNFIVSKSAKQKYCSRLCGLKFANLKRLHRRQESEQS